jgi:hypothetical protein
MVEILSKNRKMKKSLMKKKMKKKDKMVEILN